MGREEDGLLGSRYYVDHPLVPLADRSATSTSTSRARTCCRACATPASRSRPRPAAPACGRSWLDAIDAGPLDTEMLSAIFGQGRSDYVSFLGRQAPTVFFTDATGPCYHTNDDEIGVVDFGKLDARSPSRCAWRASWPTPARRRRSCPNTPPPPSTTRRCLRGAAELIWEDRDRFSAADQQTLTDIRAELTQIVQDGRGGLRRNDVDTRAVRRRQRRHLDPAEGNSFGLPRARGGAPARAVERFALKSGRGHAARPRSPESSRCRRRPSRSRSRARPEPVGSRWGASARRDCPGRRVLTLLRRRRLAAGAAGRGGSASAAVNSPPPCCDRAAREGRQRLVALGLPTSAALASM